MAMTISGTGGITFPSTAVQGDAAIGTGGQTWQNLTSSRASGTTYTNNTGRSIMVAVTPNTTGSTSTVYVNGVAVFNAPFFNASFIVPNGQTYSATLAGGLYLWAELR